MDVSIGEDMSEGDYVRQFVRGGDARGSALSPIERAAAAAGGRERGRVSPPAADAPSLLSQLRETISGGRPSWMPTVEAEDGGVAESVLRGTVFGLRDQLVK